MGRLTRLTAAVFLTCMAAAPSRAEANERWLVLVIDCSDSIKDDEYRLQKNAYVNLLQDPQVQSALDRTQLAIIEFSSEPVVVVDWSDVWTAGHAYALAPKAGICEESTGIGRALRLAIEMLQDREGARVIDVSGDGADNIEQHPRGESVAEIREHALSAEIQINGLSIDDKDGHPVAKYYSQYVVSGFLIGVRGLEDFRLALRHKLFAEIAQLEEQR